ncbi:sodium/hydrogen exchanger 9B2-like [Oppia nitens]|uniref:sodium/hydrogen exchanger 9B2-like n=1 Tax=Oppia nitens TaxID=1686743 RepID=UPI0023DBF0CF|nr:sodium/hydrogen exchanger 9B2-like [Oppia nitens]
MLIIGFISGNVFDLNLNEKLSSTFRSIALVIILLRAGLGLDPNVIKKLSGICIRLSLIPCIGEAFTISVVTYLLMDLPFVWGILLGFILSGVSSAIVIPDMIVLQEEQLGTNKGIPTLLMASASVDNVVAITGFGVCLSFVFDNNSSLVWNIFKAPVTVVAGIVGGVVFGLILWLIPIKCCPQEEQQNDFKLLRLCLLLLIGMFLVFVSKKVGFDGSGPLGCLIFSFITSLKWRSSPFYEQLRNYLCYLWLIFEVSLFVLIGSEVKISDLNNSSIGFAVISLFIGLLMRSIITVMVTFGANFKYKEKLFITLSWIPKATVQAAIGPIALDLARDRNDLQLINYAKLVLTLAVLSIIITAPLGSIGISLSAKKCLQYAKRLDYSTEI